jgi:hypothetical protein
VTVLPSGEAQGFLISIHWTKEFVMSVRAKMRCVSVEPSVDGVGGTVRLEPVIGGSPENDQFYKYTPGGGVSLSTINQAAIEQFELYKEFYVDITPA